MQFPTLQNCLASALLSTFLLSPAFASDFSNTTEETGIDLWAGSYAGFSVGYGTGGGVIDSYNGTKAFGLIDSSLVFGGHLGYNFAPFGRSESGGWIWGMELDLSGLDFNKTKNDPILGAVKLDSSYVLSTKLKAGYAWDDLYLYGTLGLGFSELNFNNAGDKGHTLYGGLVYGLGAEYALTDKWRARVEATAYDFGSVNYKINGRSYEVDHGMATIKLGFSRKF